MNDLKRMQQSMEVHLNHHHHNCHLMTNLIPQTNNNGNQSEPIPDVKLGADDETISNTDDGDDNDDDDDYDAFDVLESFNSAEQKYVQHIITLIENNRDILTWSRKTGGTVFLQQAVQDSNIIELLKDTLTENLHPIGKMEFYRGLVMLKVKLSCIRHPKIKSSDYFEGRLENCK